MRTKSYEIRRGRPSSAEMRRELIEAFKDYEGSQADFCRQHGLNPKTFGRWLRLEREARGERCMGFQEVEVAVRSVPVEVVLPNGIGIRLTDVRNVGGLVSQLAVLETGRC